MDILLTYSHFSCPKIITEDLTCSDLEALTYYNQRVGLEIKLDEINF